MKTQYPKNQYPAQIKIDERIVALCREKSKLLPSCPRPNVGSFGHFVKTAIKKQLLEMVKKPNYINELFEGLEK